MSFQQVLFIRRLQLVIGPQTNLAGYYSLLYFWCFEWLTVSCCYNTEQAEEILHSELFYSENSEGLHADD